MLGEPATEDSMVSVRARPDDIRTEFPREHNRAGQITHWPQKKTVQEINSIPGHSRVARIVRIDECVVGFWSITEREPSHIMSESSQLQGQFPEPAEAIIDKILTHVLAFG